MIIYTILECHPLCVCEKREFSIGVDVKCSHLSKVPASFPYETTSLDLRNNPKIAQITDDDFRECNNLEMLDISQNNISHIHSNVFKSLVNLKSLDMSNFLKHPFNISFDRLFSNLSELEYFNIQNNFRFRAISYPTEIFSKILDQLPGNLKSLYIDIPKSPNVASYLSKFTHLVNLGIFAKDQYRMIIANDTFKPLEKLPIRNLTLNSLWLTKIEAMAFSWFSKLESLDMSNSRGMAINDLSDAWFGMNHIQLRYLNLTNFQRPYGQPHCISAFFRYFKFDYLTELFLDEARIEGSSDWRFSRRAKNLRTLSLSGNNLNNSQISKILTNLRNLTQLTFLKLSNQLPRKSDSLTKVKIELDLPPKLEDLIMSKILVWPSDQNLYLQLNLRRNNTLKKIQLKHNGIVQVEKPFIDKPNPNVPISIDFRFNKLTSLAFLNDSVVRGLKIERLFVTGNMLGKTLNETVFERFHNLERLDLGSNGIKQLPGKVFINQKKFTNFKFMG